MAKIPGCYKQSLEGFRTFLANPLPPRLSLPAAVVQEIEETTHLLGQVKMCRILLPNADLLIYSSLRREALASSTIEGTIASSDQLVRYQASQNTDNQQVREVDNYRQALEWGCAQLASQPIAYRLIIGLHERLLHDVRGASSAGHIKNRQNRIGSHPDEPIEAAIFIPAAPEDTMGLITAMEQYVNNPNNKESKIVQCALVHYQFETIHPFNDGNGRVGRLLIILQLMQLGLLNAPLIHPSVYFEKARDEYYQRLQDVRDRAAWIAWVTFFTRAIKQQCLETLEFTNVILALQDHLQNEVRNVARRVSVGQVLTTFFKAPVLSVTEVADMAGMAYNSAQTALQELEKHGIVKELTGKRKRRVYGCVPVLDAIFGTSQQQEKKTQAS